jgi:hypothetical protein
LFCKRRQEARVFVLYKDRPNISLPFIHAPSAFIELYDTTDTYQSPYQTITNTNDALTITPADLAGAS